MWLIITYYNSDLSFYFHLVDYYELIPEFRHVEETIYVYNDLQLKKIKQFSFIDFYYGNRPKNESFCGIICLGQKYYSESKIINDIIN